MTSFFDLLVLGMAGKAMAGAAPTPSGSKAIARQAVAATRTSHPANDHRKKEVWRHHGTGAPRMRSVRVLRQ